VREGERRKKGMDDPRFWVGYRPAAHARNSHISTSGLKSDFTIVFLNLNFLQDAGISATRVHLTQYMVVINSRMYFEDLLAWNGRGLEAKWGKGWCDVYTNELVFTFKGFKDCANFGENPSRNASVRLHADGHTHRGKRDS